MERLGSPTYCPQNSTLLCEINLLLIYFKLCNDLRSSLCEWTMLHNSGQIAKAIIGLLVKPHRATVHLRSCQDTILTKPLIIIIIIFNQFYLFTQYTMDLSSDFVANQLKSQGIRPSYQRIKVLEYLYQKGGHPTVDDIFRSLSSEIPSLSKVTIYNTLHTLVEAGLVKVVDIDDTETRFDITLTRHGHFQCESCGVIFNFQVNIDQITVDGLNHFKIKEKNVYFKGLCPSCLKKNQGLE